MLQCAYSLSYSFLHQFICNFVFVIICKLDLRDKLSLRGYVLGLVSNFEKFPVSIKRVIVPKVCLEQFINSVIILKNCESTLFIPLLFICFFFLLSKSFSTPNTYFGYFVWVAFVSNYLFCPIFALLFFLIYLHFLFKINTVFVDDLL